MAIGSSSVAVQQDWPQTVPHQPMRHSLYVAVQSVLLGRPKEHRTRQDVRFGHCPSRCGKRPTAPVTVLILSRLADSLASFRSLHEPRCVYMAQYTLVTLSLVRTPSHNEGRQLAVPQVVQKSRSCWYDEGAPCLGCRSF